MRQVSKMAIKPFRTEELGAVEVDLSGILARLDITLTTLRDALRGASAKDLTTVEADIEAVFTAVDTIEALQGTANTHLGGAGGVIERLTSILTSVDGLEGMVDTIEALQGTANTHLGGAGGVIERLTSILTSVDGLEGMVDTLEVLQGAANTGLAVIATNTDSATAWNHGHITVASTTTPVQGPNIAVAPGKAVSVVYHPDSTGRFGIGKSAALANPAGTGGPVLLSAVGQSAMFYVSNVNQLWVGATVNGGRVFWFVEA